MSAIHPSAAACGCCEGVEPLTPQLTANRPGLDALRYRIGVYATFFETMAARLGSMTIPVEEYLSGPPPSPPANGKQASGEMRAVAPEADEPEEPDGSRPQEPDPQDVDNAANPPEAAPAGPPAPLRVLTTREASDPAIALLDAWAIVGDVLTFYQERIANEGYLRTAVERHSVMELARHVGYRARPGLSASVYLSFTLEDSFTDETTVSAGTKAQSQPVGDDEKPQVFETAEPITVRTSWNRIRPRRTQPQVMTGSTTDFYVQGLNLNLRKGDRLLVEGLTANPVLWRVGAVTEERAENRTHIELAPTGASQSAAQPTSSAIAAGGPSSLGATLRALLGILNDVDDDELANESIQEALDNLVRSLLLAMDALTERDSAARRPVLERAEAALLALMNQLSELLALEWSETLCVALTLMHQLTGQTLAILRGEEPSPVEGDPIQFYVKKLTAPRSAAAIPPPTPYHLALDTKAAFNATSDLRLRLLTTTLGGTTQAGVTLLSDLYKVTRTYGLGSSNGQDQDMLFALVGGGGAGVKVYVLRTSAAPFGYNAPLRATVPTAGNTVTFAEWEIDDPLGTGSGNTLPHHTQGQLYLDAEYEVAPGSWVYVERNGAPVLSFQPAAAQIQQGALAAYGLAGKSTLLTLPSGTTWYALQNNEEPPLSVARSARVYLGAEELILAEEPISDSVPSQNDRRTIELGGVYEGLTPGRWLVVAGERADLGDVAGVQASELVMLQNVAVASGDGAPRTVLTFANDLENRYRRDTVVLYANTVRATHGETVAEVLGGGDARRRWQSFALRKPPLTYLPAPTPAGAESTLTVRVNDVRWREADNHVLLGPDDRAYVLERKEEPEFDATTVIFGDGRNGARLPSGVENVGAVYRSGLGKAGNVLAGRIKQLATRPLGVKDVINLLPASGGADREGRDQIRANAPLAVMALDRLVSVQDYADFARTFAGIGKAAAAELSDGRRTVVHLTIAGADDIPIAKTSDLYRNLRLALARAGDPWTPVQIEVRELALLVIIAGVRIHPDYLWSVVAPQIRARLYDVLSFARRDLGQDVTASEVIAAIHATPGVLFVDLDVLDALSESDMRSTQFAARLAELGDKGAAVGAMPDQRVVAEMARPNPDPAMAGQLLAAQLAYLDPRVPETLILKELTL